MKIGYYNAPLYIDKYEAVRYCAKKANSDSLAAQVIIDALDNPFWGIREIALKKIEGIIDSNRKEIIKQKLLTLALEDKKSIIRADALAALAQHYKDIELTIFEDAMEDMSYLVIGEALSAIAKRDSIKGLKYAKTLKKEKNQAIVRAMIDILGKNGSDDDNDFFIEGIATNTSYKKGVFINGYGKYLTHPNRNEELVEQGISILKNVIEAKKEKYDAVYAIRALSKIANKYKSDVEQQNSPEKIAALKEKQTEIENYIETFKTNETNDDLLEFLE